MAAVSMLSLLDEPEAELQVYALRQLHDLLDSQWSDVAPQVAKFELLYENESFPERELAAAVASKVFYHLEELDTALKYALCAGDRFDLGGSEYVQTLVSKCLDEYIRLRGTRGGRGQLIPASPRSKLRQDQEAADRMADDEEDDQKVAEPETIDPRLEAVVERMFDRCLSQGQFKHALGIALEAHRVDRIKQAVIQSGGPAAQREMLDYLVTLARDTIMHKQWRRRVFRTLVELYTELETPDYLNMVQALHLLNDPQGVASVLDSLINNSTDPDAALLAYQAAFDLQENQDQPFLDQVVASLPASSEQVAVSSSAAASSSSTPAAAESADVAPKDAKFDDSVAARRKRLQGILSGRTPREFYLQFLFGHNHTDLNILRRIKEQLDPKNSVTHTATVMAHALMQAGTTDDSFLRENRPWIEKAKNWAKFTATSSLGVVHKGDTTNGLKLLDPFLPKPGQARGSAYQEAGALYALGLINVQSGPTGEIIERMTEQLNQPPVERRDDSVAASPGEILQHGSCLGIGLAAMASHDRGLVDQLRELLFSESPVAGSAAGLAVGLVLMGSNDQLVLEEMMAYAHDSRREKIIRGLAMGMGFVMYAAEEEAEPVLRQMRTDKDPVIRYGGMWATALAYVGTGNNAAVQRLLHVAVSDVSDDVRRAATAAVGFVMANAPSQVPKLVGLLAESYNPHVRYGACLAVGVACASTGLKEAVDLLAPLASDKVDHVRQGALLSLGLVLNQHTAAREPRVQELRNAYDERIASHRDTLAKFGAIVGAGILDAGGRNQAISLLSPGAGHRKMQAVAGLVMFAQYWYWFPFAHFLALSLTPTALLSLNQQLQVPSGFAVRSNAPASHFAYPKPISLKKAEVKKQVKTATLSVAKKTKTAKKEAAAAVAAKKEEEAKSAAASAAGADEGKMDTSSDEAPAAADDKKSKEAGAADEHEEEEEETQFEILCNPSRVTWAQQPFISLPQGDEPLPEAAAAEFGRYQPIKEQLSGITMLRDTQPERPETLYVSKQPKGLMADEEEGEPLPPADFVFRR